MKSWIKLILVGLIGLLGSISDPATATSEVEQRKPLIVATVEDHPWVIKNETSSKENPIYTGFLVDLLNKVCDEYKYNYTIQDFGKIGTEGKDGWTGVIGAVLLKKADFALSALNITTEREEVLDFSSPFINHSGKNKTFALGFAKNSSLIPSFSHMIKKLINQRYMEQLQESWFVEGMDMWDKKKQLTAF